MSISFYADVISTISHEWIGHPTGPNHRNIAEIPPIVPYTIDCRTYNSDHPDRVDIYGVSFDPLPADAFDVKMCVGARMRTTHHFGRFYAHLGIYNGMDHWYTVSEILDPNYWEAVCTDVIRDWTRDEINLITQIKLKGDTNPIDIGALYLYIQYELLG